MELARPTTIEERNGLIAFAKQQLNSIAHPAWTGLTRALDGSTDEVGDIDGKWSVHGDTGGLNPSGDGTCIEILSNGRFNDLDCNYHRRSAICYRK